MNFTPKLQMTDKEKIQLLIDEYGKTQEGFASLLGVATSTVANWRFRNKLTPTAMNLILRKCTDVNPEWLEGVSDTFKLDLPADTNKIRVYDDIMVVDGQVKHADHADAPQAVSVPDVSSTESVVVSGCSLQPTIQQGDIIGIHEFNDWSQFKKGDVYFILTKENERLLKYIYGDEDPNYIFGFSENALVPPITIPKENIFRIYKVDFTIRRF